MASDEFSEDFSVGNYLWEDPDWSYSSGGYYQQNTASNYLRLRFQAYPGSEQCVVPYTTLFSLAPAKYPFLYFYIEAYNRPGNVGTTDFWFDTDVDIGGYGIGVRVHRVSTTELRIYSRYYSGDTPSWNLFHTFNPGIEWFNISFKVNRNCADYEYYSDLEYFKVNGVDVGSAGWGNKVERSTTPIVYNERILRLYCTSSGTATSWRYDPRFDNLNVRMEDFPKNKYAKFPRWQKTKYGMRPCY